MEPLELWSQRLCLRRLLTDEVIAKAYASVRRSVAKAYGINPPVECPYGYAQLMEEAE